MIRRSFSLVDMITHTKFQIALMLMVNRFEAYFVAYYAYFTAELHQF